MQFLPSTWVRYASDGNGDGVADPQNVFDATLGAGRYLCADGLDLHDPDQQLRAILRYNNSMAYASDVRRWSATYSGAGRVPIDHAVSSPEPAPTNPTVRQPSTRNLIPHHRTRRPR